MLTVKRCSDPLQEQVRRTGQELRGHVAGPPARPDAGGRDEVYYGYRSLPWRVYVGVYVTYCLEKQGSALYSLEPHYRASVFSVTRPCPILHRPSPTRVIFDRASEHMAIARGAEG
jgi:hypothetical protein